ncbi:MULTISPECIES: potassium transporter Trk [Microbacterium]|uniref:Potassium transporter Trk n=1 Tax=Microbacterium algihabitans TaxID=3075992 RepID=A0ABU3RSU6_9MICO|nr:MULTISPECIES: potassium transporter Trk [Microbacterium]MCM3501231.1 potassium transporter Trk [Microbacterium sp. P26]MDU0325972.1 potassium transporter Trk [Microbacterium sp. KSW2-21]
MAEQPAPERPVYVRDDIETVTVRRAPKYGVFLAAGAFLGILAALILTFAIDGSNLSPYTQVVYSELQVFGFTALICVVVGVVLAAIVALIFERTLGGRTRQVMVDHEQYEV